MKPRCFVAMAFDYDDTDAVYERLIEPVLRRNGLMPVIINRKQSNDDLNIQIMHELGTCDVCIADLTYARPSVYFEAGFAQARVPVIYTSRRDHIPPRQSPEGHRVHFDLQMKPLLDWGSASDSRFAKRLEARLKATFLNEWNSKRAANDSLAKARQAFRQRSLNARLYLIRDRAMRVLRGFGFREWAPDRPFGSYEQYDEYAQMPWPLKSVLYDRRAFVGVTIQATSQLVKKGIEELSPLIGERAFRDFLSYLDNGKVYPSVGTIHNLVFTLTPVSYRQVEAVLPNVFGREREGQYSRSLEIEISYPKARTVECRATLDFMPAIQSEPEFTAGLKALMEQLLAGGKK